MLYAQLICCNSDVCVYIAMQYVYLVIQSVTTIRMTKQRFGLELRVDELRKYVSRNRSQQNYNFISFVHSILKVRFYLELLLLTILYTYVCMQTIDILFHSRTVLHQHIYVCINCLQFILYAAVSSSSCLIFLIRTRAQCRGPFLF